MSTEDTVSLPGFEADTAVGTSARPLAAAISERWWVGKGPNGGYVAAVILRAIRPRRRSGATLAHRPLPAGAARRPGRDRRRGRARGRPRNLLSARSARTGKCRRQRRRCSRRTGARTLQRGSRSPTRGPGSCTRSTRPGKAGRTCCRTTAFAPPSASAPSPAARPATAPRSRTREPRLLDAPWRRPLLDTWFPSPFARPAPPPRAPTIDYTVHFRSPLPPAGPPPEDGTLTSRTPGTRPPCGFFEEDGGLPACCVPAQSYDPHLSRPDQADQGRRERRVLCTQVTEDTDMRRSGRSGESLGGAAARSGSACR